MRLIILAAGQGTRLRPLTDTRPKCLVELRGRPLLDWQLDAARRAGVGDVVAVTGYRADLVRRPGLRVVHNSEYATTNMVTTLFSAEHLFEEGFVVSYGDIVYDSAVLEALLAHGASIGVVVDRSWSSYWQQRFADPLADAESLRLDSEGRITSIGQPETDLHRIEAQYIGLVSFRGDGVAALRAAYESARRDEHEGRLPFGGTRPLARLFMTDLLQGMIDLGHKLTAVPIDGGWLEIDTPHDLAVAEDELLRGRLGEPVR